VHNLHLSSSKVKISPPLNHAEMRQDGTAVERLLKTVLLICIFSFFPFAVSWRGGSSSSSKMPSERSALWWTLARRRAAADVRFGRWFCFVLLSPACGAASALPATGGQPSARI
jgi:hypothetical protein